MKTEIFKIFVSNDIEGGVNKYLTSGWKIKNQSVSINEFITVVAITFIMEKNDE